MKEETMLVGLNGATISNSYATGSVLWDGTAAGGFKGGLASSAGNGTFSNSFYDMGTTLQNSIEFLFFFYVIVFTFQNLL
jgi:hypothetical protein